MINFGFVPQSRVILEEVILSMALPRLLVMEILTGWFANCVYFVKWLSRGWPLKNRK